MVYLILAVNLAVLALIVVFAIRFLRAPKEKRSEMLGIQKNKRAIILLASVFMAVAIVIAGTFFFFVGTTGMGAGSAAKDYLEGQYGPSATWEISWGAHIERSKKPAAGTHEIDYRYAGKTGSLLVEYVERDGKITYKVTPKQK